MSTPEEFINTVINNALRTASEFTDKVGTAAGDLMHAGRGTSIDAPGTTSSFDVMSGELELPKVDGPALSYEAQMSTIITVLTQQLVKFFANYYPLGADAFSDATNKLINIITNGGHQLDTKVIDYEIIPYYDITTDDGTDTVIAVDLAEATLTGSTTISVDTAMTKGSLDSADGLGEVDTSIGLIDIDSIATDIQVSTDTDIADLTSSGIGLNPEVAEQEWQRARERVIADGRRTEGQVVAGYAAKGYTLVPGAMLRKIAESRTAQLMANGASATEIAAKQVAFSLELARLEKDIIEKRISFQFDKSKLDTDIAEKEIAFNIDIAKIKAEADLSWKQVGYDITLATKKADLEIEVARLDLDRLKLNADIESKEIAFNIDIAAKQVDFNIERAKLGTGTARIELERQIKQIEFATDIAEKNSKFKLEKENLKNSITKLEAEKAKIKAEVLKIENDMVTFAIESAIKSRTMAMTAAGDYIRTMATVPNVAIQATSLVTDIQSKMMGAAADFYRARLGRDELVLKAYQSEVEADIEVYKVRNSTSATIDGHEVQALTAAADAFARTAASALSSLNSIVATATNSFA